MNASIATELEAKLVPSRRFRMPPLAGFVTVSRPVRELDATYYDTPELELARFGITLRYREGEPGPRWTLKLPGNTEHSAITRDELTFEGRVDVVPDDARDLVRCFTRGIPLRTVVRLRTRRTPIDVRDADGNTLLEIDDDAVSVTGAHIALDHFREVEVEASGDTRQNRAALRSVVATLIDAGCRDERPVPKLIRALGPRAEEPPSVVAGSVGRHASVADLIRHLSAVSVVELLTHDPGVRLGHDPEAVHLYRVATRRLRSDLRTFSPFLDSDQTDRLRGALHWLGTAVGPVRDLDVLSDRIAAHVRALPDQDQPGAAELLARLATSRREAHENLLEVLRCERYDDTVRALVAFATEPPIATAAHTRAARPAAHRARSLVGRRWMQLAAAVDAGGENPTDAQLHEIRIAAKRGRYATEAVIPVVGRPARRFAAGVEQIQTVLGDYHDTIVAEAWLRNAAAELIDARLAVGELIAAEFAERARLRSRWPAAWHEASRPKARSWL